MSGRRYWLWTAVEVVAVVILGLNAMDLASDAWPALRNEAYPWRTLEELGTQYILLAFFFMWLAARIPTIVRAVRSLPVPRAPLAVLGVVAVIEMVHVAYHVEVFPFSHVGMFSFVEPAPTPEWWTDGWHVVDEHGERHTFSYFRLGDPWLAEPFALDGRTSWIFYEHRGKRLVKKRLEEELAKVGITGPPVHERWLVRMADGRVVEIWDPRQAANP
jgi:hypothetical protein